MQNQINPTAVLQFIQQVKTAELSQAKEVKLTMQQARLLSLNISELIEKINQDYETLLNELRRSQDTEVVAVSMDGGGFDQK